jgi:GATA-binding protein
MSDNVFQAPSDPNGLPAAHPDVSASIEAARRASQAHRIPSGASERSTSPISRTNTPGLNINAHPSNIAPQHMFDSVSVDHQAFSSPSLPQFIYRAASPSASSINGNNSSHLEPPLSYDALQASCTALKTRVSELEVINELFRGRVGELESNEQEARQAKDNESRYIAELGEFAAREMDLKRRIEELESEVAEYREGPRQKKMRLSDIVDDGSQASTPLSTES